MIPLDAVFRTQDGARVTLGEVLRGGLPAILTFNYSDCPMLCSVQLNGLTAALPKVGELGASPDPTKGNTLFRVGAQFRIVTIDLEPSETLEKVQQMRQRYLDRLPEDQRAEARQGWTFLIAATPGDGAAIRRVADAIGFRYATMSYRARRVGPPGGADPAERGGRRDPLSLRRRVHTRPRHARVDPQGRRCRSRLARSAF